MSIPIDVLSQRVSAAASLPAGASLPGDTDEIIEEFLDALERGAVKAATREADGTWRAVPWVKQGILLAFRAGTVVDMSPHTLEDRATGRRGSPFRFFDKDTLPYRELRLEDGVRVVPGGSSIRRGTFIAAGVVCMPPVFINAGASIGAGTMIDSHALVGSCAQVGARVHVSAAAQIGGVLEPINAAPVVVEDDAVVGGNCGVYEGTVVRARAVLAAGVVLTRGTPVFDLVREQVYRGSPTTVLEVPEGAVVVPGARAVHGAWAEHERLSIQTPVIVKYRDERTDLSTTLEAWLR